MDKKHEITMSGEPVSIDLPVTETVYMGVQRMLKYASLVTLTVQNAALNLTMRMARTQHDLFIASTAVVMAEVLKLITCLFMVGIEEGSLKKWLLTLNKTVIKQPWDTFKVAIPSLVYTLQNNLIYIGATHLDAATCQVTYQLKILTTALFSILMLNRKLNFHQWIALLMLFLGVACVQLAQLKTGSVNVEGHTQKPIVGFVAIFLACCLSGFAGVYFEKILKGSDISVWMRNVQLSVFSIPIGLCTVYIVDRDEVDAKGFYFGYNFLVWVVIFLQAIGGLVVAVVVKFADNILKGFATSLAIVLSCVISMYAFDFNLTGSFVVGSSLVIGSTFLYNRPVKLSNSHKMLE